MNCENCQHGGTIVPKPKIKVVQGNVLRLAIPLTLRTIMKDGDEIEHQDTDFIPSSEHPVLVVFGKGKTNIPVIATMDENLAVVEERGKLPVGTYDITVECFDDAGQPYRFKKGAAVQVVDTTAEAGIEETIEYEAQTWYLDSAIYLATTEIGSLSEEIDRKVSDLFGYADYDATNKAIRFYDKSKTQVLTTLDATPFIADGMVENVYIDVERQVLVVVLNAEAGSRMFTVPLYLIFANYYTKTQVDNRLSSMETFNFDTYVAKEYLLARDNNVSTEKMPHLVLYSMGRPYDYVSELGIGQPYFANGYISIRTNSLQALTIGQPSTRVVYCNAATNKLYRWNGTEFVLAGLDENVIFGAFVSGKFMRFTYNTETREWENTSLRVVESPYIIYVEVIENKTFRFDTKDGFVLVGDGSNGGGGSFEQVQADWNQSDSSRVDYIKNKPTIPTKTSDLTNDSGYITEDDIPEGATVDSAMSSSSDNPVKNKVIKKYVDDGLADKQDTITDLATIRSGASAGATAYQKPASGIPASDIASGVIPSLNGYVTTSAMNTALATKQDTLTFDDAPTANSNNPVKSGGIKTYVDGKVSITGITTSQDGTFTITQSDGNSFTVDLNHTHPQYLKYQLLVDEAAYNALATKDSGTLYLIPES